MRMHAGCHFSLADVVKAPLRFRDSIHQPKMEREAAIRLLRALVAVGLRQRELIANATIESIAIQAGLHEFDAAQQYARQQGWLVEAGVRLRFELMGRPGRYSHPPTPRRPDQKSLQTEATTCIDPGSLDCPGFFSVAVKQRASGRPAVG